MVVPGEKMYQDMSYQISAAEDNERLWNDNHTDSIDEDLSNDVDHFSTLDEYYKHCSTFLDWGKLHGYGPQHFDSPPASSLLPTSNDGLNENKSFPCDSCGKVYKLSSSLYSHKKFECGKVPTFKCLFCPQRTFQKGSMKRHMKRIHNSDAAPLNVK
ncbi:zinc finger protein with KRAB and SCAN domains 7-like isoform X1 [Frankliniella occidentalis]|uniref:Zinc finger protein with KRAB and SCAN domains 7-like isoform X1 n=1 Tax=Frankliniella occidentalis TaxID=133901 RepID=A0A6J1TDT0_FRAOC|nr:zinc finger protein with KRAB and SCAN domains 7-like isoform X1 [Frankliniella occidentalis]